VPSSDKIFTLPKLKSQVKNWQTEGNEIVFTNGCFDILHLGHIDYLEKASLIGDKLIVALNTDSSVRKLKGENRPINDEYARSRMIASLSFVDAVILFNQETPLKLITEVLPDILIKGSDYLTENIVGADIVTKNGGKVDTVDLVNGYSTTAIIDKIKNS